MAEASGGDFIDPHFWNIENREEMKIVKGYLMRMTTWEDISTIVKKEIVNTLVCPFNIEKACLKTVIEDVDNYFRLKRQ